MKQQDAWLHRLLVAASKAPPRMSSAPAPMSATLTTRVLAEWRAARQIDRGADFLLGMYRWALTCAALLMVAAVVWSFSVSERAASAEPSAEPGDLLASSEVQADLLP